MKREWISNLALEGGRCFQREVRDGNVIVRRLPKGRRWMIWHNGRRCSHDFTTAKDAMEYVDDAECAG